MMSNNPPKISVVIPVYNGELYLAEAIDSILSQTYSDFELIIINDGSTDRSRQIIAGYDDHRIRVIENEANLGITATRNIGMETSKGMYVAILDCDDYAYHARLAKQVAFLDSNPGFAMVASWADVLKDSDIGKDKHEVWELDLPVGQIPPYLLFNNCIYHSSVMLRKAVIPEPAYRDFAPAEDYDLWVRLARKHKLGMLNQTLIRYRIHEQNISRRQASIQEKFAREIILGQLNVLGLNPNTEEMDLHRLLAAEDPRINRDQLRPIEKWLKKILLANNSCNAYESSALHEIVAARWKTACKHVCKNHPFAFIQCLSSELSKNHRMEFISRAFKLIRTGRV